MTALATVRHTVRATAARTRRTVMWSPRRFRTAIAAAVAVLVLVPLVSLVARAPWTRTAGSAAVDTQVEGSGASGGQGGGSVANGLGAGPVLVPGGDGATADGARPTGTGGPTTDPAAGATTDPGAPVDASPLAVRAVLDVSAATPTKGPSRDPGATGATLSPGAATDRWKAQARTSAVRFSQAWLAGATASDAGTWLGTLTPWLDPGAEDLVALTNLAAIPRTTAMTVQLLTLTEVEASAVVVLADGGRLDLELVWDGESWRVTSYEPVTADGVAAPARTGTPPVPVTSTASSTRGAPATP
ncbi:MAG: hypothetical protein ACKVZ6_06260 [Kineosporiaceae bacterium]